MTTDRQDVTFVVKEGPDGETAIVAEPEFEIAGFSGLVGFDLQPGTSLEQARHVAELMRSHIRGISVTL
ncbi:MAG: hypothetical protein ACR2J1_00545 [Methyloceanibacter sp.]|uniref:hypothetical protein n=1 Tax=Methyloceanibacter sp. TaxID=1965321 RepID=UPI003D9B4798